MLPDKKIRTFVPNRTVSVVITVIGAILFFGAAFDLFPLDRDSYFLCLFFGLMLLAGGMVLLMVQFEFSESLPPTVDDLLGKEEYEEAFKLVLKDQSTRGVVDESSLQRGVDYLVANGVAPEDALTNLQAVLTSYVNQTTQE